MRIGRRYDVVVISYGGSGTTLLARTLGRFMRVNAPNSERDGILHACSPTHPIFENLKIGRAIYVYANPPEAVLSIFNRGFQGRMQAKINSMHRNRAAYLRNIRENTVAMELDDLLRRGTDPFCIGEHLNNWTNPQAGNFPILCVKYEALFESKSIIAEYVDTPRLVDFFPEQRPRNTRLSDLKPRRRDALLQIYKAECQVYESLPDVFIPKHAATENE